MTKKRYILFASTLPEINAQNINYDPLNKKYNSEKRFIEAYNKGEAIIAFQESDFYSQYCEERNFPPVVYTYIWDEDAKSFQRADLIPLEIQDKE